MGRISSPKNPLNNQEPFFHCSYQSDRLKKGKQPYIIIYIYNHIYIHISYILYSIPYTVRILWDYDRFTDPCMVHFNVCFFSLLIYPYGMLGGLESRVSPPLRLDCRSKRMAIASFSWTMNRATLNKKNVNAMNHEILIGSILKNGWVVYGSFSSPMVHDMNHESS